LGTKKDFTTIAILYRHLYHTFETTDSHTDPTLPLLVYTSDYEGFNYTNINDGIIGTGAMADKSLGTKTTAVEAYDRPLGNSYRKSGDGLYGNGQGSGSVEMTGDEGVRAANGEDVVDEVVLEQGIQALESKKTAWYAYLTTKDFWIVLVIGYVISLFFKTEKH
jgi:hypothetical protein